MDIIEEALGWPGDESKAIKNILRKFNTMMYGFLAEGRFRKIKYSDYSTEVLENKYFETKTPSYFLK